ncbi:mucin-like protein 1 [Coprinopsis cinerea AmutBmut pab1-1]|nr:mucin-like protein 1 [Coprinopsis cinerea AmutBmut pab1-1]
MFPQPPTVTSTPFNRPDTALVLAEARGQRAISLLTNTYRPPPTVNPIDEALSLFHSVLPFAFQLRRYKDDPSSLFSLVAALHHSRFRDTRDLDHLMQSISLHRQALELRPVPNPSRMHSLRNLAEVLDVMFDETRDDTVLEEAVEVGREAVSSSPPPEIHDVEEVVFGTPLFAWVRSLSQLGQALERLFHVRGSLSHLEEAIAVHHQNLVPFTNPDARLYRSGNRPAIPSSLSRCLSARYRLLGDSADLEESINLQRQALEAISPAVTL